MGQFTRRGFVGSLLGVARKGARRSAEEQRCLVGQHWTGRNPPYIDRGLMTERGLDHAVACVEATKKVLGDQIGLAFDCGPGWTPKDAIRFARAVEPYHLAWLEDLITGDHEPYPNAQVFKQVKDSTTTPIHTGEEIYLRENFKDLIETQAVDAIVKNGFIDVWDKPGLGITFNVRAAKTHLREDRDFFD
jgi:L-alanine-DL-glutamate epimerase-like enolase superfamily enzyme